MTAPSVVLMIPVWGDDYIDDFLGLSLRSLLAPGNLPALASSCECTFRFLTHEQSQARIRAHPMFEPLSRLCPVDFVLIDDITYPNTYSTTLTLAFERGIRHSGEAQTRTHFVFLVADWIVADGSLGRLVPYLLRGVSGLTSGNFQICRETAVAALRNAVDPSTGALALAARDLVRLSLDHLHPMVLANMVGNPLSHSPTCNRLFWRAGADALVGRFYLRHMLCIRPETERFVVGSSCDYSFIPEMCPSGNVVALEDSDEFLVVELQPRQHEQADIVPGPLLAPELAARLASWTTREHRRNVATAVVFHAGESTPEIARVKAESAAFVAQVGSRLPASPQPHRGHPYWRGATSAAAEYAARRARFAEWTRFTLPEAAGYVTAADRWQPLAVLRQAYEVVFGAGVRVHPWHPDWSEQRLVRPVLEEARPIARLLVVAGGAGIETDWLVRHRLSGWSFHSVPELIAAGPEGVAEGPFDECLALLDSHELTDLQPLVGQLSRRVRRGGRVRIYVRNRHGGSIESQLAAHAPDLLQSGVTLQAVRFVRSRSRGRIGSAWQRHLRDVATRTTPPRVAWGALCLAGLAAASLVGNLVRWLLPSLGGPATGALATLTVE